MNEELLAKAKAAKSPEELLQLMRENGMPEFSEENAKMYFDHLHKSGELSDDELDQAVGGCEINGKTVVTNQKKCHNGQYLSIYDRIENGFLEVRKDMNWNYPALRNLWSNTALVMCESKDKLKRDANACGLCVHLQFTSAGIGYCEIN